MNDEYIEKRIKELADKARKEFADCALAGRPIDLNNIDEVLALLYAQHCELRALRVNYDELTHVAMVPYVPGSWMPE